MIWSCSCSCHKISLHEEYENRNDPLQVEPSRTATPVGATTPLRSPTSSIPSTPQSVHQHPLPWSTAPMMIHNEYVKVLRFCWGGWISFRYQGSGLAGLSVKQAHERTALHPNPSSYSSEACRAGLLSWDNKELWIWNQNYGIQLLSAAGKASHVFWTPALVSFCFRVVGFHAIRSISCLLHIPRKGAKASSSLQNESAENKKITNASL